MVNTFVFHKRTFL